MTRGAVVIGLGNSYRRDDGIGPAVAGAVDELRLPGVRVIGCATETTAILDAWERARLAVVVDAAAGESPGRVRCCGLGELVEPHAVSSHELNLRQTYDLAVELGRAPDSVVVVTVDIADAGHGRGLSAQVAAALPAAVAVIRQVVLEQAQEAADQQP